MPYSRIREAPESSSAATLRAVVAALTDAWHLPQSSTPTEKRLLPLSSHMPEFLVKKAVARKVRSQALDPALARHVTSEGLARQAVAHYTHAEGHVGYPAIIVGAPNGGVAYLAALLGAAFLPSHFLLSFADRTDPDDVVTYYAHGSELINTILKSSPDLVAVNHYDPIHDRFLVAEVNHVRLKLQDMPQAYQQFISEHLAPGGTVFYADNQFEWLQYKINDQHMFQVGGLGGFTDKDFIMGSDVIDNWLEQQKSSHRGGWTLPDRKPVMARESEWGTLPEFREAVEDFAYDGNYQFRALTMSYPDEFSALAYTAYLWESRLNEREPNGLLVECFSQINPTAALRADLLPLWIPFNTEDSLEFFEDMAPLVPRKLPVVMSLLPNFTKTTDLPPAQAWQDVAESIGPVQWIGTDPKRYPMDLAGMFNYVPALQQWVQQHPGQEPRPHMSPEEFLEMMQYINDEGLFADLLATFEEEEEAEPDLDAVIPEEIYEPGDVYAPDEYIQPDDYYDREP
jgi:hypothetical protein